jgi:DNA-binding CsgD family transcriptional regulator
MGVPVMLVGREKEQTLLDGLVASLPSGLSAALVLRGEAGVGKTALLDHVAATAEGVDVVRLSGLESEAHLDFAAIHRLLVPYLGLLDGLPPTQAQALRTAIGLSDAAPANSFILGLSVLTILSRVTSRRPLLVIVDDAQWLDPESVEILGFVARRLHAEHLGLLFSVREPSSHPLLEGIPAVVVAGLSAGDSVELLLSLAPDLVDRQVAERVAEKSRGNPLVIVEVGRELSAFHTPRSLLLDDPLPMSERLDRHFRDQIAELPDDAQRILLYAAAHPDANSGLVRAAAVKDGLDPDAAQPAVEAGLVRLSPRFEFRHPLIRSAVYSAATGARRRHTHEVLASQIDAQTDADLRAWHLASAATGPDEGVAAALERGAHAARSRGGYLSEAAHLARAAEMSPDPSRRAARLLSAAEAALTGGAPLRAQALLEAGLPDAQDLFLRAQLTKLQANALHRAGRPGRDTPATLLAAARVFAPIDASMARETMLEALEQTFIRGSLIVDTTPYDVGSAALDMVADDGTLTDALLLATGTYLRSGYVEAAPRIRAALEKLAADGALGEEVPRWFALGQFLAQLVWDEKAAHDWLLGCERLARRTGALEFLTMTLIPLSSVEMVLGRFASADSRLVDLRQLSRAIGVAEERAGRIENARLLAWLGRDDDARRAARRSHETGARIGAGNHQRLAQLALVVLELGRGRYAEAYGLAKVLIEQDTLGVTSEALPYLVEAATRSGHPGEATLALDGLRTRATASGTPWALGVLATSEALVAPDDRAEPRYLEAVGHLEQTEVRTDLARAHLLYGEWLRRRKRRSDARRQLRIAQDMFDDMGAAAFAERARTELAATGERSTGDRHGLTPQEAQIARLAAGGATNQEIATQLFISTHTVEYHLGKVFRKLDVTSRRLLRVAME